jgi:hypothetical protein
LILRIPCSTAALISWYMMSILDGGRISVRIVFFGLVIENSVRLVIFRKM